MSNCDTQTAFPSPPLGAERAGVRWGIPERLPAPTSPSRGARGPLPPEGGAGLLSGAARCVHTLALSRDWMRANRISLSAPGNGEGRGEVGDSRALAGAHLTLPRCAQAPPSPPGRAERGFSAALRDVCIRWRFHGIGSPSPPPGAERAGVRWGIPERLPAPTSPSALRGPLPLPPEGRRGASQSPGETGVERRRRTNGIIKRAATKSPPISRSASL
jgi:hypothetical protein